MIHARKWMRKSLQFSRRYAFLNIVLVLPSFQKEKIAFLQFSEWVYQPASIIYSICRRWTPGLFSKDIAYSKSFAWRMFGWDDIRLDGCVPMFSSPYVPQSLCSPVPLFPIPCIPRPYIPQSLYSTIPFFPDEVCPMFPSIYPPQFLCSQVPMFSDPFRHQSRFAPEAISRPYVPQIVFPVPMLPNHCSPVPMFPSIVLHSPCSSKMYPGPFVPQRCFRVHTFHKCVSPVTVFTVPISTWSVSEYIRFSVPIVPVPMFLRSVSRPYVPQRYPPVPMLPSTYIHLDLCSPVPMIPQSASSPYVPRIFSPEYPKRDIGAAGASFGQHRDWEACLGNIGKGRHFWDIEVPWLWNLRMGSTGIRDIFGEDRDWANFFGI